MGLSPSFAAIISRGHPFTGPPEVNLALTSFGFVWSIVVTLAASFAFTALTISTTRLSGNTSALELIACVSPPLLEQEIVMTVARARNKVERSFIGLLRYQACDCGPTKV